MRRAVLLTTLAVVVAAPPAVASAAAARSASASPAATTATILPGAAVPARPGPVLPGLDPAVPTPGAGLAAALDAALADTATFGPAVAAEVIDVATGTSLLHRSATRAAVPASTTKILTGAAVLSLRGGEDTLATRVLDGASGEVVLVGGGDVLLAAGTGRPQAVIGRAGLDDLAAKTAAALTGAGRTAVRVSLDDTLFTGPATGPGWNGGDVAGGFVAPVSALAMDAGNASPGRRPAPGRPFARSADPAMAAAEAFAARLRDHGIDVLAAPRRSTAAPGAEQLAEVRSAPVADLVEQALTDSDNTVAEALARLVALSSNHEPTFTGAGQAILDRLSVLGVDTSGQTLAGGSGLGTGYAVSPHTLVRVLALAASPEQPALRPVLTGLPVAGGSGTLAERFSTATARPARGVVRAKTGTLTGVSSLAGTVVDADGRLLAFAVLADRVPATDRARDALDSLAGALARCGCR